MWEICKSAADAAKEFDRTMDFIAGTLKEYKAMLKADNAFVQMDREPRSGISPHISPYLMYSSERPRGHVFTVFRCIPIRCLHAVLSTRCAIPSSRPDVCAFST